ncbi:MAG: hypothetical protein VYE73_08595 [Acidobacteriota bacterium]|nr:hypothetical protein [Acidobacteriota bacterium]
MRAILEALLGAPDRLLGAIPIEAGRWLVVGFLLTAALATFLLPRWYIYLGCPDERRRRDLRWWALAATLPYVLIYAWF